MNVTNNLNINWNEVNPKFNFAAMDITGAVMLYTECPEIDDPKQSIGGWWVPFIPDWGICHTSDGRSILKAPVDWKDTLTERPVIK